MASRPNLHQTPSQTVGPFFAYGLTPQQYNYPLSDLAGGVMATAETPGEHIRVEGCVYDGAGAVVEDAMVELWQADAQGRYAHPADPRGTGAEFRGFGRVGTGTDERRRFAFRTIKPGSVDGRQAPHIGVILFMRGLLVHLYTRIYFDDEAVANAVDPVLAAVPQDRRHTLIARRAATADGTVYRFDIRMQGPDETVFLDV